MHASQNWQRQIQKPALILIHQTVAFFKDMPMLAIDQCRGLQAFCDSFDHLQRLVGLWSDHAGHTRLYNTRLFGGNFGKRIAKKLFVVDRHRSNDTKRRSVNHICGVEPPSKADLK